MRDHGRTFPVPAWVLIALTTACGARSSQPTTTDATDTGDTGDTTDTTATDGTTEDGTSTGDGDDDDGCSFPGCPDMGGCPGEKPCESCDPGTQDCPEGKKCTVYKDDPEACSFDATGCVDIVGDKQLYEPCTRTNYDDDCAPGLYCATEPKGEPGEGVCWAFCDINDPLSCQKIFSSDSKCITFSDNVEAWCVPACNPLGPDCPAPLRCVAQGSEEFTCLPTRCDPPEPGENNDPCVDPYSCLPGLECVVGTSLADCDDASCCTPFCTCDPSQPGGIDSNECTDPGEQCVCWYAQMAPEGLEDVGTCRLPG